MKFVSIHIYVTIHLYGVFVCLFLCCYFLFICLFVCFFPHIFNKGIHIPISHIITTTCPLLSRSLSCTDLSHHSGTQNLWGCPSGVIGSHLSPLGLWGRGIHTSGLFFHIPWILDWIGILGVWRPGQSLGLVLKLFQGSFCSVDGHIVLFVGGGGATGWEIRDLLGLQLGWALKEQPHECQDTVIPRRTGICSSFRFTWFWCCGSSGHCAYCIWKDQSLKIRVRWNCTKVNKMSTE